MKILLRSFCLTLSLPLMLLSACSDGNDDGPENNETVRFEVVLDDINSIPNDARVIVTWFQGRDEGDFEDSGYIAYNQPLELDDENRFSINTADLFTNTEDIYIACDRGGADDSCTDPNDCPCEDSSDQAIVSGVVIVSGFPKDFVNKKSFEDDNGDVDGYASLNPDQQGSFVNVLK